MKLSRTSGGPVCIWAGVCCLVLSVGTGVVCQGGPPACAPAANPVCTCNEGQRTVDCNGLTPTLYKVPSSVPADTRSLSLSNNGIQALRKGDFKNLEQLTSLNLESNAITYIEGGAFDNLFKLQTLNLRNNALTQINQDMFQHLPSIALLDLSNNDIKRINKKSFLTFPASVSSSGVIIKLEGNTGIICDCDTRAMRDWSRSLAQPAGLAQFHWHGFYCSNAENTDLNDMRNVQFGACDQAALFDELQNCSTCMNVSSSHQCDTTGIAQCQALRPVCRSRIYREGDNQTITVSKQCTSHSECLLQEQDNAQNCGLDHANTDSPLRCVFCCSGPRCSDGDMGGRTYSLKVHVHLRMKMTFLPYMLDSSKARYQQTATIYTNKLKEMFEGQGSGIYVEFESFGDETPCTLVSTTVYTTSLSTAQATEIIQNLYNEVVKSAQTGFLKNKNIQHYYVGAAQPPDSTTKCKAETTETAEGSITWEETRAGDTARVDCLPTMGSCLGHVTRRCVFGDSCMAQWEDSDLKGDLYYGDPTDQLIQLSNMQITAVNVDTVMKQLDNLTSDASTLSTYEVDKAVKTMEHALSQPHTLESSEAMESTVNSISNLMDLDIDVVGDDQAFKITASKLVAAADKISTQGQLSDDRLLITGKNLAVAAQAVKTDVSHGLTISALPRDDGSFQEGDVKVDLDVLDSAEGDKNRLVLPASVLDQAPGARIALVVHRTSHMFEAMKADSNSSSDNAEDDGKEFITQINSCVIAASIVGHVVTDLQDPVTFTLLHRDLNSSNVRCVYWDEESLEWSATGCYQVQDRSTDNFTTCHCDHLTNFALLMDVYGKGAWLSVSDSKALSIISFIGCGLSLMALMLTLLTYLFFRKLRRDNPSKILINLCVALAISNLVFVVGMHPYALDDVVGCKIVAVLLHFSLLSSLCWMAVEAVYMYLALVLVFNTYFSHFLLKCSLVGWGIPTVTVIVTLATNNTDNYGPLASGICWLQTVPFYAAFLGPVSLILLVNFLVFGLVLRQIVGLSDRKMNKSDSITVTQQLRGALGVVILLGLTWIFAVLAVDQASVVLSYLFAIFNTLQGVWIFLFYCLMKKEARASWSRVLSICPTTEDKSAVSTSKSKSCEKAYEVGSVGNSISAGPHHVHIMSARPTTAVTSDTSAAMSSSLTQLDTTMLSQSAVTSTADQQESTDTQG